MSSPQQPKPCGACGGTRLTQQTRHSVITHPDGSQEHTTETITAQCTSCHGSGHS